jgi:RNA polymerase sigma factor (sigma-70 family)
VEEPSGGTRSDDALWETERRRTLHDAAAAAIEAFDNLDDLDCLILRLRHLEGFTLARIGEEVGLSHQRVHERVKRGEARVRDILAQEGIQHEDLFD